MAKICSAHQDYEEGCELCNTEPWQLLGITEEQWVTAVAEAEASGLITCPSCNFTMYRIAVNSYPYCIACNTKLNLGDEA